MIYLIGEQPDLGPVKVGYSIHPPTRLATLRAPTDQTKVPTGVRREHLAILATSSGGYQEERAIHTTWVGRRVVGEWFDMGTDLTAVLHAFADVLGAAGLSMDDSASTQAIPAHVSRIPYGRLRREYRMQRKQRCQCTKHDARLCLAYHRCCSLCVVQ